MPHDRKGVELKEGDTVTLLCRVEKVFPGESACNVQVKALDPDCAAGFAGCRHTGDRT